MRTLATLSALALALALLGGCGTRTSLQLPPKPVPAAPSAKPAEPAIDDSKAGGEAAR